MKQTADNVTTGTVSVKAPFTAGVIGLTFLDTTWRIVAPVLLFAALGILADRALGTGPWLTIVVAVPVGFVFAALLIKKQIEAVNRAEQKRTRKGKE